MGRGLLRRALLPTGVEELALHTRLLHSHTENHTEELVLPPASLEAPQRLRQPGLSAGRLLEGVVIAHRCPRLRPRL